MSEAAVAAGFTGLLSDDRLTRRAIGGDERAFAAIFRRYHQPLYRFCLAIVGNAEDAQDALQNTMIKVLRALPGEERRIELKPWLYRIAHNESIDLLRRRRETRELAAEQPAPGYGLAEDAATRERLRRLIADLKELPDRQREVVVMRELAGLDFDEIGTALDTSGAVARQALYEARQSLRQMEEGREMSCETVTKALSDGDGRVTRRRDVRAHLRSCAGCRSFRDEIQGRRRDLAALSPLPAVAAAGMLQGLIGGSQAAVGSGGLAALLGGGAAKSIGVSAAAKGAATVAAVAAIGVTAADRTGVIHVPLPGSGAKSSESAPLNPGAPHEHGGPAHGLGGAGIAPGKPAASAGAKAGKGAPPASPSANGKGLDHAAPQAGSKAQGPTAPAHGRGHEKQHPAAATRGQETAEAHKPPPHVPPQEVSGGKGGGQEAVPPTPPPHPTAPSIPGEPKKSPPTSVSPPQGQPTEPPSPVSAPAPPQSQPQPQPPAAKPTGSGPPAAPGSEAADKGKGP
ncbi:MAG TPA: sigma-70 family RNA polymerase sigma factor [Solirubrobacterales bacterium]|nr:sigma-70 family RNA polymerase sigma factor [Solirubrobacterales bacterium]